MEKTITHGINRTESELIIRGIAVAADLLFGAQMPAAATLLVEEVGRRKKAMEAKA